MVQFCPAFSVAGRMGQLLVFRVVPGRGDRGKGDRVTANVGYRYPLSSASQSFLQDAEVQAGGGKRQGQRGIELGGGQEHTTDAGITDSAVRQCLPAPHQGRSMICSRPVQVRGGGELTLALVIDLHLSGRDVTGTCFSTANWLPFSPRHQNGAVPEKRGSVSVTPCRHVTGQTPSVVNCIVEFR